MNVEFVSRQPDRAADRRPAAATPRTATRSRACSSSPATTVEREYYFNDAGAQVARFGESIQARARGEEPPEDGYQGDYVAELAQRRSPARPTRDADELGRRGRRADAWRASARRSTRFRVEFDACFLERSLHEGDPAPIERALERAARSRATSTSRGRAVAAHDRRSATTRTACCVRSNGEPTYFASDIAYHAGQARARLRPR